MNCNPANDQNKYVVMKLRDPRYTRERSCRRNNNNNNNNSEIASNIVTTTPSPNYDVQTLQLTFNGAVNLKNSSGNCYVIVRIINFLTHTILQYEPFSFNLGNIRGYIELNHNIPEVPNHTIDHPTRLRVANNPNISYTQILSSYDSCGCNGVCNCNGGGGRRVGRLRLYISNNPNYVPRIGDFVEASGHCIQWIKNTTIPC